MKRALIGLALVAMAACGGEPASDVGVATSAITAGTFTYNVAPHFAMSFREKFPDSTYFTEEVGTAPDFAPVGAVVKLTVDAGVFGSNKWHVTVGTYPGDTQPHFVCTLMTFSSTANVGTNTNTPDSGNRNAGGLGAFFPAWTPYGGTPSIRSDTTRHEIARLAQGGNLGISKCNWSNHLGEPPFALTDAAIVSGYASGSSASTPLYLVMALRNYSGGSTWVQYHELH